MSTPSFKNLTQNDITATTTMLNERIPLTGTLISGSARYGTSAADGRAINIKSFSHNMFQSVYDYPHLSSSANHIFDITAGFSAVGSQSVSSSANIDVSKKVNIYNQMAQVLVGYDVSGNVRRFDPDGNFSNASEKMENAVFINFSRMLVKDEIKKGSFRLSIGTGNTYAAPFASKAEISDADSAENYRNNSPAGEYGFLKNGADTVGLIYYQAGVAALTSSLFGDTTQILNHATCSHEEVLEKNTISSIADGIRHRIDNITFDNVTELNSSIYFCRVNHNDFNYSSNPTYLSESKIVVKNIPGVANQASLNPITYITTVGLYSANNELMAVAKLSEPLKKTPDNEFTLRVRLDY